MSTFVLLLLCLLVCPWLYSLRQRDPLPLSVVPGSNFSYEFIHIAKNAGRAIKSMDNRLTKRDKLQKGYFSKKHKHATKTRDVESRGQVAVFVLRDVIDRFQSAFAFVRSGGFGQAPHAAHGMNHFNSSDALVMALRQGDLNAFEAIRCDSKMRFCSPSFQNTATGFNAYIHTSIEFRPQKWWINHLHDENVRLICYNDLTTVFPSMNKIRNKDRNRNSLKGHHWYVTRDLEISGNIQYLREEFYKEDAVLYEKYCNN